MHATCPAHLILLDLIIRITFQVEDKSWSSQACNFLQFLVNSSLSDPNSCLSTLFSHTLSPCSSLNVRGDLQQLSFWTPRQELQWAYIFPTAAILGSYIWSRYDQKLQCQKRAYVRTYTFSFAHCGKPTRSL
jgi:hypothetical protein